MTSFTHLHVHSHFTLLGATASPQELARQARADGLDALALTDSNALYGAVAFAQACRAAGIRPIIGMTLPVAAESPLDLQDGLGPGLLVVLSTGEQGYRSLCRLASAIQAHPDRAERAARGLHWQTLKEHAGGLICLSGGRRGWIERRLRAGDEADALRHAGLLVDAFGERAFLALEIHRQDDEQVAAELIRLGERAGLRAAAVQPVYCLARQDRPRLRLLAAIAQNRRLADVPQHALPDGGDPGIDLHWLRPAEVAARFAGLPGALETAAAIAAQCEPGLPDGRRTVMAWPAAKFPAAASPDDALAALAAAGLQERYAPAPDQAARQRLQHELDAIGQQGFAPLFLLVADLVRFARENDIPVSTRGSVANSLVAYCAGVTTVDPIEHDLLFERFLNPARRNPPDIDLDFCSRRRDRVLAYVRATYGPDHVALVATVNTMGARSAVRAAAKAHGLGDDETSRLAKLAPHGWHPDPRRRSTRTLADVAGEQDDPLHRQALLDAAALVGQPGHLGVHPGAVVITPGPLADLTPLQWTAKGFLISQYAHDAVEAIGLVKIDLLGIRALTVLADAAELVRRRLDAGFRLEAIPLDDAPAGDTLARGDTIGVFQCDSAGAQRTLRQLRAHSVQDLAVANAFFKPGPALGGMATAFVQRYRGEAPVTYLHPALEPILGRTQGVLIFQEQILRIAVEIAGLSWQQADHLRRGMSHFGRAEMAAMQSVFTAGCMRPPPDGPGFSPLQAQTLWEQVLPFAGYGFNQGHATAYADVSYRSAYVRAHYPAAFFAARLANFGGYHHPAIYIAEAQRLGIPVHPPHVNHSGRRFTLGSALRAGAPVGERRFALWMGLGQVRDLRAATIRAIQRQRRERRFASLYDFLSRVELQAKEAQHLVQCGALDRLGASRAEMLAQLADVRRAGSALQASFGFDAEPVAPDTPAERLAWETHLLGWPVSVTPLAALAGLPEGGVRLADLPATAGQPVTALGYRLPGWTGGKGFFLGDGQTYVTAIGPEGTANPRPWQPLAVAGRWRIDRWGRAILAAAGWTPL
jgi:DNA-directed DNA polymerase III PolC